MCAAGVDCTGGKFTLGVTRHGQGRSCASADQRVPHSASFWSRGALLPIFAIFVRKLLFLIYHAVQVFQGDELITEPEPVRVSMDSISLPYPDEVQDRDAQLRYDSYAAYPPETFANIKAAGR